MRLKIFDIKKRIDTATGETLFYAQIHAPCKSTMGSGEWWPSMRRAVEEAREGITDHLGKCANCAAIREVEVKS